MKCCFGHTTSMKKVPKCHQLEEIIVQVRGFILDNSTACKGKKSIRASTWWIAHKLGQ